MPAPRKVRSARARAARPAEREPAERTSATRQVADALRAEILKRGDAESYLGREDELVERFGVSKPTFRQAAKLLEHERVLVIKRGPGGGFFGQPPTERMVSHMAAMVLASRGATLRQVTGVLAPLTVEAIRELASRPDAATRSRVRDFVVAHAGFQDLADGRQRGRVIADFERLVASLTGNPALHLFVEAIRAITRDPGYAHFQISKSQAAKVAESYRRLADLIADGDVEMAVIAAQRYVTMLNGWIPHARAGQPAEGPSDRS